MDSSSIKSALFEKDTKIRVEDIQNSIQFLKNNGYDVHNIIGVGGQGVVLEASTKERKNKVAIKMYFTPDQKFMKNCVDEASFLQQISSPYVVQYLEQLYDEVKTIFYIVSEFCSNGDLENYIKKNPVIPKNTIIHLFQGVLNGIIDIQKKDIIHGDLKTLNIVISAEGNALLTDFGLSRKLIEDQSKITMKGGTLAYSSPEQNETGKLVPQSDYFSAGVILFQLCRPQSSVAELTQLKNGVFPNDLKQCANLNLVEVAKKMMKLPPKERMSPQDAIKALDQMREASPEIKQKNITPLSSSFEKRQYPNGKYEGLIAQGKRQGKGIFYFPNGDRFEGEYQNDLRCGNGTRFNSNGDKFVGKYENDLATGPGTYYYANGDKHSGQYQNGQQNGFGIFFFQNGDRYEGGFKDNQRSGQGTRMNTNGETFVGQYENGQATGKGIYYYVDGKRHEGEYKYGKPNGFGTFYDYNDQVICKGRWKDGVFQG